RLVARGEVEQRPELRLDPLARRELLACLRRLAVFEEVTAALEERLGEGLVGRLSVYVARHRDEEDDRDEGFTRACEGRHLRRERALRRARVCSMVGPLGALRARTDTRWRPSLCGGRETTAPRSEAKSRAASASTRKGTSKAPAKSDSHSEA